MGRRMDLGLFNKNLTGIDQMLIGLDEPGGPQDEQLLRDISLG